ncbi:CSMD [Mytilus coruscus]|uniref:CSMD n=1 Tax=Mytilus coruscus TaxID=42192 RepID=A0A6J8CVC2_MYTCO|nr:CSMD [Mytilus coruscus]
MVICYWIDFAPMQHSTAHCGMFDYAWVPDSGADYILHQLALQRGSSSGAIYHIGYTLNYTTSTEYTVIDRNDKPQSYSAFTSTMDPSNTCVGFIDGHWDDIPCTLYREAFCSLVIRCQTPVVNSGSTLISQTGDMYGDTCYYTCDIGHVLVSGNLTRTCLIDGTWDNSSPVCNVIRCQTPFVNSGSTLISQTGDMYGDTCYYTCDIGHVLVSGNLTRTCLIDGTWDNSSPVCNEILTSDTTTDIVSTTDKISTAESTTDKISIAGSTTDKISTAESISSNMSTSTVHQQVSTATTIVMKTTYYLDISETTTLTETITYNQDMTKTTTYNQETTERTSGVTSGTTSGLCVCACSLFLNITIDIEKRIEELKILLAVDKKVLSSTIRRLTCADDPRPSSAYIGYTGAIIIVAVFTLIIIIDIINIYVFFKTFRKCFRIKRVENTL